MVARRHRRSPSLSEVRCSSEFCKQPASGIIGFPTPASPSPFPVRTCGSYRPPSPDHFRVGFILSTALRLVQSLRRSVSAQSLPTVGTFLGVAFPLRDINRQRRCNERPRLAAFRPRRFSRPRRFDPLPALWVCFAPQPRSGCSLQGFSLPHSRTISSMAVALSSLTTVRYWQFHRCRSSDFTTSATPDRPALRALLRAEVRCRKRW